MTMVWVDTDFGFDDLWALLLLDRLGCRVAGVSLVAGNSPLAQVASNALGAQLAYGLSWPLWQGAARPLVRAQETAQSVLGETGIQSRGQTLPQPNPDTVATGAITALREWLMSDHPEHKEILAIGPLTNIADLLQTFPEVRDKIARLVWMGASTGRGNHTPWAEYNAVADAEAVEIVLNANLPMDIVDLEFCRLCLFDERDIPTTDPLTRDLLGGYLDIALQRGRSGMAIYDPLAALAIARPDSIEFTPCTCTVTTAVTEKYGNTQFDIGAGGNTRVATKARADLGALCLAALNQEVAHAPGQ